MTWPLMVNLWVVCSIQHAEYVQDKTTLDLLKISNISNKVSISTPDNIILTD